MGALEDIRQGLQVPQFKFNTKTGETLNIAVYKGYVGLTVWIQGENHPVYRKSLNIEGISLFTSVLDKVADPSYAPNMKESLLFTVWDTNTKTETPDAAILIGRDERGMYYIEVQFTRNGNKKLIKFNIVGSSTIKHTSTANAEDEWVSRSRSKLNAMRLWFDKYVPLAIIMTGEKRSNDRRGGNGGGNNNAQF